MRNKKVHILRVYTNGDRVADTLPIEEAEEELAYSQKHRKACALFLGKNCVWEGDLGKAKCETIADMIEIPYEEELDAKKLSARVDILESALRAIVRWETTSGEQAVRKLAAEAIYDGTDIKTWQVIAAPPTK